MGNPSGRSGLLIQFRPNRDRCKKETLDEGKRTDFLTYARARALIMSLAKEAQPAYVLLAAVMIEESRVDG